MFNCSGMGLSDCGAIWRSWWFGFGERETLDIDLTDPSLGGPTGGGEHCPNDSKFNSEFTFLCARSGGEVRIGNGLTTPALLAGGGPAETTRAIGEENGGSPNFSSSPVSELSLRVLRTASLLPDTCSSIYSDSASASLGEQTVGESEDTRRILPIRCGGEDSPPERGDPTDFCLTMTGVGEESRSPLRRVFVNPPEGIPITRSGMLLPVLITVLSSNKLFKKEGEVVLRLPARISIARCALSSAAAIAFSRGDGTSSSTRAIIAAMSRRVSPAAIPSLITV
mmetsp:Transcript_93531/g.183358  ORF Transcript_93531/g.183358 Transcript_93531/m.183358 type:complete len:282 (-) Transcript_93531:1262-2107(-)